MTERFGQYFVIKEVPLAEHGAMTTQELDKPVATETRGDSGKRRQIIEGACRMFLAQGFDAASMGAIAREAGVSKGTLYVYFKNKEELFEAIVEQQCRQQAEQIFTFDLTAKIDAELQRVGEQLVQFLCRPDGLPPLRTIIAIADRMPELGARFYLAGPARGIASLKGYLESKVAEGILEPHDSEVAAAQFIDACVSLTFKPMLFNYRGAPDDAHIAYVVGIAVRTMLAAYRRA
jgi:AcrR family transcriptional regulator